MSGCHVVFRGYYKVVRISYDRMSCRGISYDGLSLRGVCFNGISCEVEYQVDETSPLVRKSLDLNPIELTYYWEEALNDEIRHRLSDLLDYERRQAEKRLRDSLQK